MIARALAIGAAMAIWGFVTAVGLAAKCGHGAVVDLEVGAATAAFLFAVTPVMYIVGEIIEERNAG